MPPIPIVDSHVHFWDPGRLRYDWLRSVPAIGGAFSPADLFAEARDLAPEQIVFVQADCAAEEGVAEVEWVTELARDEPRIRGIVAFAPLERGEDARPYLDELVQFPMVKGVRRLIQAEELGFCTQPDFVRGVQLLSEYDFSFDICIVHPQMQDAIELVRQCADISFVLDHFGKPDIRNGIVEPWSAQIEELASFPNVWCKLSGLVTEADHHNWTPDDLQPYIDRVLEVFGPDRLMFGGDWPVSKLASDYHEWAQTALDSISHLPEADQRAIMHDNAVRFYRL